VRLGGVPHDPFLGPQVHLAVTDLEPEAAPLAEGAGFSTSRRPRSPQ
jgi:hypothetical protein